MRALILDYRWLPFSVSSCGRERRSKLWPLSLLSSEIGRFRYAKQKSSLRCNVIEIILSEKVVQTIG